MTQIKKNYTIDIVVTDSDSGEVVVKGEALSFESAEEQLGKLERYVEKVEKDEFMKMDDHE